MRRRVGAEHGGSGAPRRVPAGPWASALATLCLLAHGASDLHFVLVEHGRCAEHGEVVHDARSHGAHEWSIDRRDAARDDGAPARSLRAAALDEHGSHEHCAASSDRRKLAAPAVTSIDERDPARAHSQQPAPATSPLAARARYRIAPKTSPPA